MISIPEGAVWFGLEVSDGKGQWVRVESAELGGELGKWWNVGAVDPAQLAERASSEIGMAFQARVVWAPKDRRQTLGHSLPFVAGENKQPVQDAPQAPQEAPRRAGDQGPPPEAIAAQAAPFGHRMPPPPPPPPPPPRGETPYMQPVIPMPFAPPPAGAGNDPLTQLVYLHSLLRQDAGMLHAQMLASMQATIESERTRSREAVEAMRLHYQVMDGARERMTAVLLEASKTHETPQLAALGSELKMLAEHIEDMRDAQEDDEETRQDMLMRLSQEPSEMERVVAGIQNTIAAVANSPLGPAIAEALTGKVKDAAE